ncbi:MAG: DNA mismatch repair protein MutS [Culicoidibacterales bacterium]
MSIIPADTSVYTPMMQQYLTIKANYQDAFVFFRLGDFYELFFDDALLASQELEIALTGREAGASEKVPMCGVPYHAANNYIEKLIEKGYKVAICEQVEEAGAGKKLVKRDVVQVITPGTVMNQESLQDEKNNYLVTVEQIGNQFAVAYADISTGKLYASLISATAMALASEILSLDTKELVVSSQLPLALYEALQQNYGLTVSICEQTEPLPTALIASLTQTTVLPALTRLWAYIMQTQKRSLDHFQAVQFVESSQYVQMDMYSKRNLELTQTLRNNSKQGSLLWLLDKTHTAMGARLLRAWLERPLVNQASIETRLDMVAAFKADIFIRTEMKDVLKNVYDLERLVGRIAYGSANARDLAQLRRSLQQIPAITAVVQQLPEQLAIELIQQLDECPQLCQLLERAIQENPGLSIKDGDIIADGYDEALDRYRDARRNGKTWLAELEQRERETTGIKNLKVGYNRIFGYYLEVTKANIGQMPEDGRYERKQTLANAERYITPELKEMEATILQAEEKIVQLEYQLFLELREELQAYMQRLQQLATTVATIDVYQAFATVSETFGYVRPNFDSASELIIVDGRHPVVEQVIGSHAYVENDCHMGAESQILLITGPNMAGKSTYMRQVAMIAILAQVGCFVPATTAILPLFDRIFTRIGASDDLFSGQSTFMVEMMEVNNALQQATPNSLILLDEIGRGTSTYDGMAIAQSILEYIHAEVGAKTLFSTHYHELTALEQDLPKLKNVHVSAIEEDNHIVFLHKIKHGSADKSYGIHVAKLAALPEAVIARANVILETFEQAGHLSAITLPKPTTPKRRTRSKQQISFFDAPETLATPTPIREVVEVPVEVIVEVEKPSPIIEKLQGINIYELNPIQAQQLLYELHEAAKKN